MEVLVSKIQVLAEGVLISKNFEQTIVRGGKEGEGSESRGRKRTDPTECMYCHASAQSLDVLICQSA